MPEHTCGTRKLILLGLIQVITLIAIILHMFSHVMPILITNEVTRGLIEPYLHNPVIVVAAWSFIPLAIYHMIHDRRMHKDLHDRQTEITQLEADNFELEREIDALKAKANF